MNPIAETRKCSKCSTTKEVDQFNKNGLLKSGAQRYTSWCKPCVKMRDKNFYSQKAGYYRERDSVDTRKRRDAVFEYLREHPCVDCGETNILFLEFDHVSGEKVDGVGVLIRKRKSLESIFAEIDKCEVRCLHCHRKATATRGGWYVLEYMKENDL